MAISLAFIIAVVIVLAIVSKGIYNVFFHPLSGYPGPWWMTASDIGRIVYIVRGRYVLYNHDLHLKYGPVVRVGPAELSYTSAQAWKDIYGHNKVENSKDPLFYGKTPNGSDHIGIANREDHTRMRRMFSHAFSERALKKQEPLILDFANRMVTMMEKSVAKDGMVNMFDMYNFAAFDITATLAFGESLGLLETAAYTPWVKALFQGVKFMTIRGALLKIPVIGEILQFLTEGGLKKKFEDHFQYASDIVDRRLARTDSETADIWSFVLEHKTQNLTLGEMHSNASGFMIGGGETSSTTLSALTYLIIRNPETMRKIKEEMARIDVGEDRSWASLSKLVYMNACISEALRLYPPAAAGLPRVIQKGGSVICGKPVMEGTIVYVSPYAAGRSPQNFSDSHQFHPERWLPNPDAFFQNDIRDATQPFSYGPRNCIGQNLAWHEVRLLLSSLLMNFEGFSLLSNEDWMKDQRSFITWEKPPLLVRMKRSGVKA